MSTVTVEGIKIDREAWLRERRSGIGASEIAAVLGVSPYQDDTPLNLYLHKVGLLPPKEESEAMWWGTQMEPLIARRYAERNGIRFAAEQLFLRHPEHSWMIATLDRVTEDGRVVELKTIGSRGASLLGMEGTDEVPPNWIVQTQQQLMIAEACLSDAKSDAADIAAVVGGQETRFFTVRRDDRLCRQIVARGAEFWRRVEDRDPPEAIPGRDGRLLALLYPEPEGEIEASPAMQAFVDAWHDLGAEIRERKEEHERIRDELLRMMGGAEAAILMDGRRLKRSVVELPERTITMKPTTYAQLRITKARNS